MNFWRFDRAGLDPAALMVGTYDVRLVFASFVVACIGAYAALEVVERVVAAPTPRRRRGWLAAGAVSMGLGVWAMHFIGMLSFGLAVPITYELTTTVLSGIPAVVASGVVIHVLSRPKTTVRLLSGGALMGAGIGAMHYTGMEAMRGPVQLHYHPTLFIGSLIIVIALASGAFWAGFAAGRPDDGHRLGGIALGATILGTAVCAMHYTAMRAAIFHAVPTANASRLVVTPFALSVAILVVTTLILAIAVGGTRVDRSLQEAHATIARLEGLLPICAWCSKIQKADGSWQELEMYVRDHEQAEITHGICADCAAKM